jgi:hypothetical protein
MSAAGHPHQPAAGDCSVEALGVGGRAHPVVAAVDQGDGQSAERAAAGQELRLVEKAPGRQVMGLQPVLARQTVELVCRQIGQRGAAGSATADS